MAPPTGIEGLPRIHSEVRATIRRPEGFPVDETHPVSNTRVTYRLPALRYR